MIAVAVPEGFPEVLASRSAYRKFLAAGWRVENGWVVRGGEPPLFPLNGSETGNNLRVELLDDYVVGDSVQFHVVEVSPTTNERRSQNYLFNVNTGELSETDATFMLTATEEATRVIAGANWLLSAGELRSRTNDENRIPLARECHKELPPEEWKRNEYVRLVAEGKTLVAEVRDTPTKEGEAPIVAYYRISFEPLEVVLIEPPTGKEPK